MVIPKWVPQWVRDEFADERYGPETTLGLPMLGSEDPTTIEQFLGSDSLKRVWETLSQFPNAADRFSGLVAAIASAGWGFGHEALPASRKLAIASAVKKSAILILQQLSEVTEQDRYALNSIVSQKVRHYVSQVFTDELESYNQLWNDPDSFDFVPIATLQASAPAIRQIAINIASDLTFTRLDVLLDNLTQGLDEWADRDRVVVKPGHPNAARLYFIRQMTRHFVEKYGRPLRAETLALASLFFDCASLDEAALSVIAPNPAKPGGARSLS